MPAWQTDEEAWESALSRLDKGTAKDPDEKGCLIFAGTLDVDGYGKVSYKSGSRRRNRGAHVIQWERCNQQSVPKGKLIMHTCDTPACVFIGHLKLGTVQENNADRDRKLRHMHGERHVCSRVTNKQVVDIREQYATRMVSIPELAVLYGVTTSVIQCIVTGRTYKRVGGPITRTGRDKGGKHSNATLSDSDAREVFRLLKEGEVRQRKIAKMFGVSTSTISFMSKGLRWKHLAIEIGFLPQASPVAEAIGTA